MNATQQQVQLPKMVDPLDQTTKVERLTNVFSATDISTLEDFLSCTMATIEDGLLQSGFKPGIDYNRKDLLNAALPMVTDRFTTGNLTITAGWPGA